MSETDSDLEFQSADEDAEFDPGPKSKNILLNSTAAETCVVNTKEEESISYKNDLDSIENLNKSVCDWKKSIDVSASQLSVESSSERNQTDKNLDSKAEENAPSKSALTNRDLSANHCKDSKSIVDECAEENSDEIISDSFLVNNDVKTNADKGEIHRGRERIILRREKKIKEKEQLCKETPLEKEKASDLINILEDPYKNQQSTWGFSSWGSSFLSTAASSVSTFSSQVSQGLGTVLETVESTLGAPEPEELARVLNERKKEETDEVNVEDNKVDTKTSLLPDMSSWTKVLENTGSKVIMGGLDTLELIGKKTMDILTEGDPGLRKKRSAFSDKVNLSEILREAKAKADEEDSKDDSNSMNTIYYSHVFDENQGLAHLEALEMLSKQSQAKFQRLVMRHSRNIEIKKQLEEIRSICENLPTADDLSDCEKFEDFETIFKKHTLELNLPVHVEGIIKTARQINDSICRFENASEESWSSPKEIFHSSICSLAEFTAKAIETFHKIAELIMVQSNFDQDIEHCATNLTGLTTIMCIEVNNLSARYHKCLDASTEHFKNQESSEHFDSTTMATNLYVEAANSNNYIQDAYQMLVPVLQVCLLEALD